MEMKDAVKALAAIGHESRLTVYRLLVQAGPEGLPAGQLSEKTGIPPSSLSFHLKELVHAGLLTSRQEGRFVIYEARFESMAELLAYLTDNCCGGQPCAPTSVTACDPPAAARARRLNNLS
ncbi:metalloregulator ArsR/SmtB family transcription factor [Achromobacter mucicolens]|uniref:ArsR/SmtB family transcription factor n=1 Tax=Achromobacter TaxID=222 RepID=UPI0014672512|nr:MULTISPECIES: metalloregulator ArsR/SmtB family transcription factor [Achromobacter]MCP2518641.1 metalloregulator ArsR/SmtB family transcription factor [Achromobacter mucicolens]MDG9968960.1 metalloregulator ArsR/SmtB family transcription factor [Achromobacter mucicolens]CAB3906116.1 hypothetical protein LMG26684_04858 [Achromobacter mucicolens]